MVTSGMLKASILSYTPRDINGVTPNDIDVILPTIQNISIKTSSTVNSHQTITGNTLAQYSKPKPIAVTINILLQTGEIAYTYSGEEIITRNILEHIDEINKHKLVFDLTTTDMNLKHYLQNLVVQSTSFSKSSDRKDIIICSLTCTEVRFAEIGWELISKADVLGVNVGEGDDIRIVASSMNRQDDGIVKFDFYKYSTLITAFIYGNLAAFSGAQNINYAPNKLTGQYLYEHGLSADPEYYLELYGGPIDLTRGPAIYTIETYSELNWTTNSEDDPRVNYSAHFGTITVEVSEEHENVDWSRQGSVGSSALGLITLDTASLLATMKLEQSYNVLNQYASLDISESFDKFIDRKKLAETIAVRIQNEDSVKHLQDIYMTGSPKNEAVVCLEYKQPSVDISLHSTSSRYLLAKDIGSLYSYNITLGDKDTGGIETPIFGAASACNIQHRPFTQFYATRGQETFYGSDETKTFGNYQSTLLSVCVGTKLYLFILSTDIFTRANVPGTALTSQTSG